MVVAPEWLSRVAELKPGRPPWPEMVRVVVTFLVPLMIGLATDHLEFAIFVGIGSLRVSVGSSGSIAHRAVRVGTAGVFALAGYAVGRLAGGYGVVPVIVLAALGLLAALMSSGGKSLAFAGSELIIFASISGGLPASVSLPVALTTLAVGVAWGLATSIAQALIVGTPKQPDKDDTLSWARTRSYGARLVLTLAAADVVRQVAPFDNGYWVLLTVAVVLKPDLDPFTRGLQRTLGTLVGAGIGAAVLTLRPDTAWSIVTLVVLAALLPYCNERNYGLYATFLTPFVLLLLDLPAPITSSLIVGRLADTALGAGVVVVVGYLVWPSMWRWARRLRDNQRTAARGARKQSVEA